MAVTVTIEFKHWSGRTVTYEGITELERTHDGQLKIIHRTRDYLRGLTIEESYLDAEDYTIARIRI